MVQGGGKPLANAQARIDGTVFTASTGADGRFTLANVPAGSGYLLKVSAVGFASKQIPGITVTSGTKDLGTIQLATLSGPYRLVPLQPDVNPPVTQIEVGGVGYRYYIALAGDGKTPASGVNVSVRIAGGSTIPQDGDVSDSWAGRVAGVSDDSGIVRLRIPSSVLSGGAQAFEVVESGVVKAQFQASVVTRHLDQVWRHSLGGGISGKLVGIQLEGDVDFESEVRREIEGQSVRRELISRTRSGTLKAGYEVGGGAKFGAGVSYSVGAGGYVRGDLSTTYEFASTSTDPGENAMKLYVALAEPITSAASVNPMTGFFVGYVKDTFESRYLDSSLFSSSGGVRLGGYASAGAGVGLGKLSQDVHVGAFAELSGERESFFEYEKIIRGSEPQSIFTLGMAARGDASVQLGASLGETKEENKSNYGFDFFNVGGEAEFSGRVIKSQADTKPLRVEIRQMMGLQAGIPMGSAVWGLYEVAPVQAACRREYTELVGFSLPNEGAFSRLNLLAPAWNAISGGGQGSVISPSQPAALAGAVLQSAMNDGVILDYEKTVLAMKENHLGFDAELDPFVAGLGFSLEGMVGRGVEMVNERGCVWKFKRMGLETYPAVSLGDLPVQSILDLERQWAGSALVPITEAFNRVEQAVADVGNTLIQAGTGAYNATLHFGQGVMNAGSYVVTKWVPSVFGSGVPHFMPASDSGNHRPMASPDAQLAYGIGGIYRFESTNSFQGTGTLTIAYSPAEVSGLNVADLRMYYLPDGTNRWQLVGGTVNMASNTVSANITKLGTYTLAPPMPTGDLQLIPSTNTLAADGASQMTIVVTNLVLNTGGVATQQWIFTSTAAGVSILNPDLDTNAPGVQIISTNGTITLLLQAPVGGSVAYVRLASVAGDAFGSVTINLLDNLPPATPTGVAVATGQSRIWVSWQTNSEPDLAGYRVYYRMDTNGPPWDGTAAVEGMSSPVMINGTNCLLRGLALGTNYFVAVSAVDTTGNESPLSAAISVTTTSSAPTPPTAVAWRPEGGGTNILMWALSEDDGYNNRDVDHYEIWRADGSTNPPVKVGVVGAGIGIFTDNTAQAVPNPLYSLMAVTAGNLSSATAMAMLAALPANTVTAITDFNYQLNGTFEMTITGPVGGLYEVQWSDDLRQWNALTNFISSSQTSKVIDNQTPIQATRFYRSTVR